MNSMLEGVHVVRTVEFSGVDGVPNEKRADQALYHARDIFPFPALKGPPPQLWSGQRPATSASLHVVPPGGGSNGTLPHPGEEVGFVTNGFVELIVDSKPFLLGARSSFFFPLPCPTATKT